MVCRKNRSTSLGVRQGLSVGLPPESELIHLLNQGALRLRRPNAGYFPTGRAPGGGPGAMSALTAHLRGFFDAPNRPARGAGKRGISHDSTTPWVDHMLQEDVTLDYMKQHLHRDLVEELNIAASIWIPRETPCAKRSYAPMWRAP